MWGSLVFCFQSSKIEGVWNPHCQGVPYQLSDTHLVFYRRQNQAVTLIEWCCFSEYEELEPFFLTGFKQACSSMLACETPDFTGIFWFLYSILKIQGLLQYGDQVFPCSHPPELEPQQLSGSCIWTHFPWVGAVLCGVHRHDSWERNCRATLILTCTKSLCANPCWSPQSVF